MKNSGSQDLKQQAGLEEARSNARHDCLNALYALLEKQFLINECLMKRTDPVTVFLIHYNRPTKD